MSIFKTHDPNHETKINIIEGGEKKSKTLHKKIMRDKIDKEKSNKNKDPKQKKYQ